MKQEKGDKHMDRLGKLASRGTFALLLLIVALGVLGAALAHGEEGEVTTLEISMGEMFFQLEGQEQNAAIVLEAGETYAIEFKNVGAVKHVAFIGREVVTEDGVAVGYATNLLEDVEVKLEGAGWEVEAPGFIELELEPAEEAELIVTIPESLKGEWEIGCFIPGHYQAGMKAPFVIQ